MPRKPRVVVPGVAHHVTQRGTGRQIVFYTRGDRLAYLRLLQQDGRRAGLRVLAYCLLPNHIHLVAMPEEEHSLALSLRRTHGRYAQYLNARKLRCGHLWQNRFYSCALDQAHLWAAIRYVERNPVRAGLAASAEDYAWSSAAAHRMGVDRHFVLDMRFWAEAGGAERWAALLGEEERAEDSERLRRATYAGNPLGSKELVERARALDRSRTAGSQSSADGLGRFAVWANPILQAGV